MGEIEAWRFLPTPMTSINQRELRRVCGAGEPWTLEDKLYYVSLWAPGNVTMYTWPG